MSTESITGSYPLVVGVGMYQTDSEKLGFHFKGVSSGFADATMTSEGASTSEWVMIWARKDGNMSTIEFGHMDESDSSVTEHAYSGSEAGDGGKKASGVGGLFHADYSGYAPRDSFQTAHIGLWNDELTDAELVALHNSGVLFDWTANSGNYTSSGNLKEYFKIWDSDGTTTIINSGEGGNATKTSGSGAWSSSSGMDYTAIVANNLTLQSTDTTASTANPDYADMIILMENAEGTATLNTDIKGYISEDSGVTFTQGTLVDEGSWGTDKKIVAFHDLDISAQTGSAMCYKITTHNQSAGSKETKIHATSIGWR